MPMISALRILRNLLLTDETPTDPESMIVPDELDQLRRRDDALGPGANSRERGQFVGNPMKYLTPSQKLGLLPFLYQNLRALKKSYQDLDHEPQRETIDESELRTLETKASELGVDTLGYTSIENDDIFQDRRVLYPHAIVFSIEMDSEIMQTSPSYPALQEVEKTYARTGRVANTLTELLREMGFGAQAGPGLGGHTIYPVLAGRAGLGEFGRHGLIITPENGPSHRPGVIYTNITNLPEREDNSHEWVREFCDSCRRCIDACPPGAIHETPVKTTDDNVAHIDSEACGEFFAENYGCSVCVKECPFTRAGYEELKANIASSPA